MNAQFFRGTPRTDRARNQSGQPFRGGRANQKRGKGKRGGGGAGGGGKGRNFGPPRDRFVRRPGKPAGPRYRMEIAHEQEPLNVPPVAPGKLRMFVLGGLEGVGERNMQVLEYGDDIITIDCGLWFPDADLPGVDYIIPNSKYLQANKHRIRGMVMCHGHLDHIGALPHIAPLIGNPPVYCTPLTKGLIEKRQEEFQDKAPQKITTFKPRDVFQLGAFRVEVFNINHNIPEAVGFAIHTPNGTIMHSGDFKFDLSPTLGEPADVGHIAQIGDRGVLCLMMDCTSAGFPGHQISETDVMAELEEVFKNAKGRLIAVTFSSLITRVQMLMVLAEKYGRKVVLEGRSMKAYSEIAQGLKIMNLKANTLIDVRDINKYPDSKILVIGTGAQAEEFAMLMRIANHEHRFIEMKAGDTVLFSSSVIPGNERGIEALQDSLTRQGAEVVEKSSMDVHAGGHGKNEDLKLMMRLVRPKYVLPIHANYARRKFAAQLGVTVGIPFQNSFVIENGEIIEFDKSGEAIFSKYKVPAGNVLVDGLGEGDVSQIVLRDRKELAAEGILVIIVTIDDHGQSLREPEVISRGFVSLKDRPELGQELVDRTKKILANAYEKSEVNVDYLNTRIRNDIAEFIWGKTERRPMILPIIVRA
ncbi:MAG: ribonuclease J [bacterium]|nr:ribonuclease J [bacterium]